MKPLPHQEAKAQEVWETLLKYKYAYLAGTPRCVDANTEFLTPNGWKRIADYQPTDLVCQWNPDRTTKFVKPIEYHVYPNSEMIQINSPVVDICATPNHKVPYLTSRGNHGAKNLSEVLAMKAWYVPAAFKAPEPIVPITVPIELLRVLIMQTADGSIISRATMPNQIAINVKKERKKQRAKQLLEAAGIKYKIWKSGTTYERIVYTPPKEIPTKSLQLLWQAPTSLHNDLYQELLNWDGSVFIRSDTGQTEYNFTGNYDDATVFQYIASSATGKVCHMRKDKRTYANTDIYSVNVGTKVNRLLKKTNRTITNLVATSYCFTTPSGFWLMRRGDKIIPTGNSGKTLTSLLTVEKSQRIKSVLILCPKAAIKGWTKFTTDTELALTKSYTVMNYEAIGSIKERTTSASGKPIKPVKEIHLKINPADYDIVICDESHRLGKLGKPSQRYKLLQPIIEGKPHIHLSGTPFVESANQIYYQMAFQPYTPFAHKNFYEYHKEWGVPSQTQIGRDSFVADYKLAKPELLKYIDQFTVYMTHADAGITATSQAVKHYIELDNRTKTLYNELQTNKLIKVPPYIIVGDSKLALTLQLHQLESGVVKVDDKYIDIGNREKITYMRNAFKMDSNTVILAYYKGEQDLLTKLFPQCEVGSTTSKAEGVDYSGKEFIIFSFGWSGAKGIQVAERGVNINNKEPAIVNYLLVKNGVSDEVYEAVLNKANFNATLFKPKLL